MDTESQPSSDIDEEMEDGNTSAKIPKQNGSDEHKRKTGVDNESSIRGNKDWLKYIKKKKQFICKECGKRLSDGPSFEKHEQRHLGIQTTVTCYECGKQLKRSSLKKHQELHLRQHNSPKTVSVKAIKCRKNGKKILKML
ncbi:zinc finger protein 140-like [Hyla sarda]|uniref:zinc finger protein 140-like n=1 Tax=Hyla sarda TaxID=327740 RepID=UPI0024C22D63|nr:zinc finger protein 140-like [Hyla sarda]